MVMSGEVLLPVSILKNAGLSEAVNRNVRRERRSVVIVEDTKDTSDPDSEDSALCLKEEDATSDTSSSSSGQGLDLAPLPGMTQTHTVGSISCDQAALLTGSTGSGWRRQSPCLTTPTARRTSLGGGQCHSLGRTP